MFKQKFAEFLRAPKGYALFPKSHLLNECLAEVSFLRLLFQELFFDHLLLYYKIQFCELSAHLLVVVR